MFCDEVNKNRTDSNKLRIETMANEVIDPKRHWEVIDEVTYPDGSKKCFRYFNTVVNNCSKVIAGLMKGNKDCKGIGYWAVGSGESSWSNSAPPTPSVDDTKLSNETYRKPINPQDITFINEANEATDEITNKLQITVSFNEGEANGELREFGLFGGDATEAKDSGLMINRKIHPLIYKTSGMELKRTIRLTF